MLFFRDADSPITVLTGLDYWLDNLMCNVPEIAMCYHQGGFVQVGYCYNLLDCLVVFTVVLLVLSCQFQIFYFKLLEILIFANSDVVNSLGNVLVNISMQ